MKRIILHSFLFAACFAFVTSCSKDVKAPVKISNTVNSTKSTTTTQTTTDNQGSHTCGGHSSGNGGGQ